MRITLNIGLARNTGRDYPVTDAFRALKRHGFVTGASAVRSVKHDKGTEQTLIVECTSAYIPTALPRNDRQSLELLKNTAVYALATELGQDCIAVQAFPADPDANLDPSLDYAFLSGPMAAAWGDFNPDYFYTLESNKANLSISEFAKRPAGWAYV